MSCGILIWSRSRKQIQTCGNPAIHLLQVRGDTLIAICPRHGTRLKAAFPEMQVARRAA